MEQIIYNSLPPNGHFPLHLSSCDGGAPEQGEGSERGHLRARAVRRAVARQQPEDRLAQAGPGSAGGGAAAGLSGRRRRGTRAHSHGTRPGGGLRRLAPLPFGSAHPQARSSVPRLRIQPPPPHQHTHPTPTPTPPIPLTARPVLRALRRRALSILSTHTHLKFKHLFYFWNGVKGIRETAAERGAPATEAGRRGLACGSPPPPLFPPGPGAFSLLALGRGAQDASVTHPVSRFSLFSTQRAGGPETFSFRSPPFV